MPSLNDYPYGGQRASTAGDSTAPVESPIEGVARALRGGLSVYMQQQQSANNAQAWLRMLQQGNAPPQPSPLLPVTTPPPNIE